MVLCSQSFLLLLAVVLVAFNISSLVAAWDNGNKIKSATFLSPMFVLGPGSVENRYYYNVDFPRGHIALKSFNAEVIDDAGNPVPLDETYLHHWVVARYYQRGNAVITEANHKQKFRGSDFMLAKNAGLCQGGVNRHYFGLGSETRKTATHVPDPYGIEIGNPAEIPAGYQERWLLNIHAIDTRGVEDKLGCTECKCDLYNITVDEYGRAVRPDYEGGLLCCYDKTQCKLRQGFQGVRRSLYLRYTVKWMDWDSSIIPVQIYILDVTDNGKRIDGSTGIGRENGCQVEYNIQSCDATGRELDIKRTSLTFPSTGYVIYGVAHQHSGGLGSTLTSQNDVISNATETTLSVMLPLGFFELLSGNCVVLMIDVSHNPCSSAIVVNDGRVLCTSLPIYGQGKEAGNEAGYIVGMSTCYPETGSVKIDAGEKLLLESNYSNHQKHTGVMGLFYLMVAEQTPKHVPLLLDPVHIQENLKLSPYTWLVAAVSAVAITIAVAALLWLRKGREDAYEPIMG
ncbi:hypothetical protein Tsubulata_039297 [Turnera subulata]|uniref:Stress up-regulated Nod 19 protein n=1 Tax=Turnera subulata TaxID=218843 RepID=A0A9Q0FU61_9ROSI|nr:hypothetical protein Tsubulata_039297 [Turnera subulata]